MKNDHLDLFDYRVKLRRITDSNIGRLERWIKNHDIASITAFRRRLEQVHNPDATLLDKPIDGSGQERSYTKVENRARNRELSVKLRSRGYGVTSVVGFYPEGGIDRREESFLVVNSSNDPAFREVLFRLSEWYNQDSFLYKAREEPRAVLIGTNDSSGIGYGHTCVAGGFVRDVQHEFMTRLRNGGFCFTDDPNLDPITRTSWRERKEERKREHARLTNDDIAAYCIEDSVRGVLSGLCLVSEVFRLQQEGRLPVLDR